MKKLIKISILYFIALLFLYCSSKDQDYSGTWVCKGKGFENILILTKIENKDQIYRFTFSGWKKSYDSFAKQEIKFLGGMNNEVFTINIKDQNAEYSDDGREFDKEFPLYNEGEERCKLFFEFNDTKIKVKTVNCHFIYGGNGVLFDGLYKKQQ